MSAAACLRRRGEQASDQECERGQRGQVVVLLPRGEGEEAEDDGGPEEERECGLAPAVRGPAARSWARRPLESNGAPRCCAVAEGVEQRAGQERDPGQQPEQEQQPEERDAARCRSRAGCACRGSARCARCRDRTMPSRRAPAGRARRASRWPDCAARRGCAMERRGRGRRAVAAGRWSFASSRS